jgi:hypothetical protein
MHAARNPLLVVIGLTTAVLPTIWLFASLNLLFPIPLVVGLACTLAGMVKNWPATNRTWTVIGLTICLASGIGPFLLRAIADRSGRPVEIVLPVGYQGAFSIVKDSKGGREPELNHGVWMFRIPESGVLKVKKTSPFHIWHRETHVYADGKSANVRPLGVTGGDIQTRPNSFAGSTSYHGTEHRFEVINDSDLPGDGPTR